MKKITNYVAMAAIALTLSVGNTACSSDDPQPEAFELKLVDEADAALDVDPTALSEQVIKIETTAKKEDMQIQKVNDQTWCTATIKSETEIAVTAGANTATADREAKFKLVAGASSVEFSVTQAGVNPANVTLSIESDQLMESYGYYSYMGQNDKTVVKVKVTTNASRWTASATTYMGKETDVVFTKARGKNGEYMTFYLEPSVSEMLTGTITITAGDQSTDITINQQTMSEASFFKLFTDEKKTQSFANKTSLTFNATFDKDDTTDHIKTLYVTTDGGYVPIICKSGTENEADDSWLSVGGNLETLRISATSNTTGAERQLDIVIVNNESYEELFRIPVTQAAK